MKYYPICLRIADRPCLVIGGGPIAEQKVRSLLDADANVTVVSPQLTAVLTDWAGAGRIVHIARGYRRGDLVGMTLVYAATDNEELHAQVAQDAHDAGVLVNVVDRPRLCDFIVPSIVARGDLLVAVSTSGASPALAKRIRRELEASFGPEYALALTVLKRLRVDLAERGVPSAERQRIFATLAASPLVEHLQHNRRHAVERLLTAAVGRDVSLAALGVALP
jgi:precorrin-2 dehydrogenase/sirohydrochlorin ferrochelatase